MHHNLCILEKLKEQIAEKEEEIRQLEPEYKRLMTEEAKLAADIRIAEQMRKELYAKQGHLEQFRNQKERDDWLKKEIKFLEDQRGETENQISITERTMKQEEEDCETLQADQMVSLLFF